MVTEIIENFHPIDHPGPAGGSGHLGGPTCNSRLQA